MKLFFFFTALFVSFSFHSQTHYIAEKGGITVSNISGGQIFSEFDNYVRVSAGLAYTFQTKTALSFGADLLYNQYGGKFEVLIYNYPGTVINLSKDEVRYEYNYYSLPLKIGLSQGKKEFFYLNTGIIPSLQIRSLIEYPENFQGQFSPLKSIYDATDNVNRFDLAALFEVGGGVKIGEKFSVFGEVNVHYSITEFTNENHFDGAHGRHYGLTAYLGLRYMLKTSEIEQ